MRNVFWSCRSISSIQRSKRKKWSLIPRSRKKTSPIPPIPNWPKKSLTLQEHCETGRDSLKTELFESYLPTPSSGIEPEKSGAENKSQEGNPKTANHRSCPGSWTGPQDAPKTNQSLCNLFKLVYCITFKFKRYWNFKFTVSQDNITTWTNINHFYHGIFNYEMIRSFFITR